MPANSRPQTLSVISPNRTPTPSGARVTPSREETNRRYSDFAGFRQDAIYAAQQDRIAKERAQTEAAAELERKKIAAQRKAEELAAAQEKAREQASSRRMEDFRQACRQYGEAVTQLGQSVHHLKRENHQAERALCKLEIEMAQFKVQVAKQKAQTLRTRRVITNALDALDRSDRTLTDMRQMRHQLQRSITETSRLFPKKCPPPTKSDVASADSAAPRRRVVDARFFAATITCSTRSSLNKKVQPFHTTTLHK